MKLSLIKARDILTQFKLGIARGAIRKDAILAIDTRSFQKYFTDECIFDFFREAYDVYFHFDDVEGRPGDGGFFTLEEYPYIAYKQYPGDPTGSLSGYKDAISDNTSKKYIIYDGKYLLDKNNLQELKKDIFPTPDLKTI